MLTAISFSQFEQAISPGMKKRQTNSGQLNSYSPNILRNSAFTVSRSELHRSGRISASSPPGKFYHFSRSRSSYAGRRKEIAHSSGYQSLYRLIVLPFMPPMVLTSESILLHYTSKINRYLSPKCRFLPKCQYIFQEQKHANFLVFNPKIKRNWRALWQPRRDSNAWPSA